MPLPQQIGEPKSLEHFVQHLVELPAWSWLYIPEVTGTIALAVDCFPKTVDSRELSESEAEKFDAAAVAAGLKLFLCRSQLEDIIANLRQQRPTYSAAELEEAIDFYWKHDAFRDQSQKWQNQPLLWTGPHRGRMFLVVPVVVTRVALPATERHPLSRWSKSVDWTSFDDGATLGTRGSEASAPTQTLRSLRTLLRPRAISTPAPV